MTNKTGPMVSVIMPAYNAAAYIEASIASVLGQTMGDLELLVLDDGSTDQTRQRIEAAAKRDSRVRCLPNTQNMGTAKTRNRGLELCRGQYVAFLDSDDLWHPEKLEIQLALAREKQADLVYCSYAIVDEQGRKHCDDYIVPETVTFTALLKQNEIGCSTVLLRREIAQQYRFPTEVYHEDYALWLSLLKQGKRAVGDQRVLMYYYYHPDSRAGNKLASAKRRWVIYRGYLKLPVWRSAVYLMQYALAGVKKYSGLFMRKSST